MIVRMPDAIDQRLVGTVSIPLASWELQAGAERTREEKQIQDHQLLGLRPICLGAGYTVSFQNHRKLKADAREQSFGKFCC